MLKVLLVSWAGALIISSSVALLCIAGLLLSGAEVNHPPIPFLLGGIGLPLGVFFVASLIFAVWYDRAYK